MADDAEDDDLIDLVDDVNDVLVTTQGKPWTVAIIDDDPAVHHGTSFALADYRLDDRGLELLSAYSAAEGRTLLRDRPDIAVVFLDVVMESDSAGLDLVEYIRKDLGNDTVRIILRTGQPGQAPEQRVIVDYDINDYKAKTELTVDKLFTTLTATLRGYQQLQRLHQTRRGLEFIVEAAAMLFDIKSVRLLAEGVLVQIAALLDVNCAGVLVLRESVGDREPFAILAGSGIYGPVARFEAPETLDAELAALVQEAFARRSHEFSARRSVLYLRTGSGREVVVVLDTGNTLLPTDRALIEVFCSRLSAAFDNVLLCEQLQDANRSLEQRVTERTRELVSAMARVTEQRERLRDVNAFKNEILGKVAHDIKNPLAVVLGRADMLTRMLDANPVPVGDAHQQVRHIRDATAQLSSMADQLIADAMTDALAIKIRPERLDLAGLVGDVVEANRPLADRKAQILSAAAVGPLWIRGDIDRLREAIDNVLSNAVKYTRLGGRIEVETAATEDLAVVRVMDEGPGLEPDDVARLFGRFERLSARPTGGESSTGLGLSIAKRIVDLHDGQIRADPAVGRQGSVFTIELPRGPAEAAEAAADTAVRPVTRP